MKGESPAATAEPKRPSRLDGAPLTTPLRTSLGLSIFLRT